MNEDNTQKTQPEFFYKYMTADTAEKVLKNRTLRWSAHKALKDPMDLRVQFNFFEGDIEKAKELYLEKSWDMFSQKEEVSFNRAGCALKILELFKPEMTREEFTDNFAMGFDEAYAAHQNIIRKFNEEILAVFTDCKILCLCENPLNIEMWKNYAESHSGVVMAFGNVPNIDSPYKLAEPIRYSKTIPSLFDEESLSDLMSGRIDISSTAYKERIMKAFLLTKGDAFSYEQEWRIAPGGREHKAAYEDIHFDKRELKKIIFGCKMSADKRDNLHKIAANLYPHVEFYEASFKEHSFEMEIHPL